MDKITTAKLNIREELITPKLAEQYLALQKHNRRMIETVVDKYANDMERDGFILTGETIKFDTSGALFDGQHRLEACRRTGKPFRCVVIRDLPPEAFAVVDTGRKRLASDVVSIAGHSNAALLAGAARMVWQYNLNGFDGSTWGRGAGFRPNNDDILRTVDAHPDLGDAVRDVAGTYKEAGKLATPSLTAFLLFQWRRIFGVDIADAFFGKLTTGEDLAKSSPILMLRNRLQDNRAGHAKLPRRIVAALTIKAFHAWRTGRRVGTLKVLVENEQFPDVSGNSLDA